MKIRLPYMIQDQQVANTKSFDPVEWFTWETDDNEDHDQREVFLSGPVSTRVAVLDFDQDSGNLEATVPIKKTGDKFEYDIHPDPDDRRFQATSAFATVMKTLHEVESADVLGRRIKWASPGNQLLIVPRAGEWANAFYERESASLQFFSFKDQYGKTIHSSLSFDIVAHETGHAILDAIVPSLYDTITPESLALHEAIADITALTMSVTSPKLRKVLLKQTGDTISGMNAFTWIAEEFGKARGGVDGDPYLRNLANDETISSVDATEPHQLSQVLSGALFQLLNWIFERRKYQAKEGEIDDEPSGKSLVVANFIFRRIVFRALDYLPPGEISFADYGRALWAADCNSNPDSPEYRDFVAQEFVRRGIVEKTEDLASDIKSEALTGLVDLKTLVNSDWMAYDFANNHRSLLRIPDGVSRFNILERLEVSKVTFRAGEGKTRYRELLFKVQWEATEDNPVAGLPGKRGVSFGTTLAIDRATGEVAGLVTTNPRITGTDQSKQRTARLEKLMDSDMLSAETSGGATTSSTGGVLRVSGSGRALHMASGDGFQLVSSTEGDNP